MNFRQQNNFRQQYVIRCRVTSRFTGTRESLLKIEGRVVRFNSLLGAERRARDLTSEANSNPYRDVDWSYTVEPN